MLLGTHYATKNAAIESVHLYSHYTVTANSQCPTSATTTTLDFIPLSTMFEGTDNDEKRTAYNLVKRSIAIMPGMIWGTQDVAWAKLDKIFTPGFYNYMKDPANFTNAPALTGNAYEDMHYALKSNNVCTGWQPQHRIQFAHSKGDMVVPYGNYLAFRDAHPDGENI